MGIIFEVVSMDALGGFLILVVLGSVIGIVLFIWLLVGYGRIWLYTRQTVELLREQNALLKQQLDVMGDVAEPEPPPPPPSGPTARQRAANIF